MLAERARHTLSKNVRPRSLRCLRPLETAAARRPHNALRRIRFLHRVHAIGCIQRGRRFLGNHGNQLVEIGAGDARSRPVMDEHDIRRLGNHREAMRHRFRSRPAAVRETHGNFSRHAPHDIRKYFSLLRGRHQNHFIQKRTLHHMMQSHLDERPTADLCEQFVSGSAETATFSRRHQNQAIHSKVSSNLAKIIRPVAV